MNSRHLVIFDGVCNFCNGAVNFIIDNDSKVRAPYDARRLLELLGLDHTLTEKPGVAPRAVWHRAP